MQGTETFKTSILARFSTYARAHIVSGANSKHFSEEDIESSARIIRETLEILESKHFSANMQPAQLAYEIGQRVGLPAVLNQLVFHFFDDNALSQANILLLRYVLALKNDGCSISTIRNYRSDISQFFEFTGEAALLKMVTKPKLQAFLAGQKAKGLASSSIRRKLVSITQFGIWLEVERIVATHTFKWLVEFNERFGLDSLPAAPTRLEGKTNNTHEEEVNRLKGSSKGSNWRAFVFGNTTRGTSPLDANSSILAKSTSPLKSQEKRFQVKQGLYDLRSKLQARSQQYILPYLNLMLSAILFLGMGYFGYLQVFDEVEQPLAYPSSLTRPNRTLSFQGRLTDTNQNPIISASDMRFRLYDSGPSTSGGSLLWDSGTCSVTPDQDGIFAVGLGEDCGAEIGNEVFSENANVWLQVEVESEVLDPRQSIKSVAYALNSETLQGFPPADTTTGATNNTVLVMNNSGEVLLGQSNPKLDATSGTFTIEAQTLTLQTGSGSNGDITLSPDGSGEINLLSDVNVDGYIAAPGATLSATYAGGTAITLRAGPSATADIMRWQDSSGTDLGSINQNGNIGIGTTNAAAELVIVDSSDPTIAITDATNGVTLVALAQDAAAGIGTLSNHTFNISSNSLARVTILNDGNVGIGSTSPGRLLDVAGTARFTGAVDFDADIELNSTLTDVNGAVGTSGQILSSTGSGVDWVDLPAGAENYWRINLGALSPYNDTLDLLVGANSTASAKFAVLNVNIGTPAASVSSGVSGNSMFMTADGTLSTTRRQSLTIGNSSTYNTTGNVFINSNGTGNVGIGTTSSTSRLDVASTALNSDVQRWIASDGSRLGRFTETSGGHGWFEVDNSSGTAVALFRADGGASYVGSGNFGVGTTAPTAQLDIAGSASTSGTLAFRGTTDPKIDILNGENFGIRTSPGGDVGLTERFTVLNNGNVGIGTTTPDFKLQVAGDIAPENTDSDLGSSSLRWDLFANTIDVDSTVTLTGLGTGTDNTVLILNGSNQVTTDEIDPRVWGTSLVDGAGTPGYVAYWTDAETLTSEQFLSTSRGGLGADVTSAGAGEILYSTGTSAYDSLAAGTSGYILQSNGAGAPTWIDPITLSTSNYWRVNDGTISPVNDTLDLFVGSSATASAKFAVLNVNSGTPAASISSGVSGNSMFMTADGTLSTARRQSLTIGNSSTYNTTGNVFINSNGTGNVAIGSTSAAAKLQVQTTTGTAAYFLTGAGTTAGMVLSDATNYILTAGYHAAGVGYFGGAATTELSLYSNGAEAVRLDLSGNVGIADATPTYKLDVNGTGRFTGAVDFDGDIELNSTLTDVNGAVGNSGQILSSTSTGVDWVDPSTIDTDDQTLAEVLLQGNSAGATNIDMNDQLILNIGAAGTDFTSGGGLTLAGAFIANGTATLNGSLTANGSFALGDNGDTGSINTSDWDISTTGAMTGISGITNDSTFTTSGGAVNINASSNFATNINTGSSTGTLTLGGGSNNVAINSSVWDITSAGVASGLTGLTSSGTITFSGITADRLVTTTTGGELTTTISSANAASSFSDETGSGLIVYNTSPEISTSITTNSTSFDLLNATATTINFAGAASTLNIGPGSTTATSVNLAGGSGATGCTVDGATGNFSCTGTISGSNNVWQYLNGAISPLTPYTNNADFLVGSNATASAKFAVLNMMSGTPTASVSSGVSGNSMFMTADGTLSTTRRQTLTIGNSSTYDTTGNVLINSNGTGNVGIGGTNTAARLDVTGTGRFSSTLTASSGLTLSTGALNLTATSGTISLSGMSTSSLDFGANDIAFTAGNFNTTATGINSTAIGATTPSTAAFTTLSSTGATTLGNNGSTVAINSSTWDINSSGVGSGFTGFSSSGTITFSGLTTDRLVTTTTGGELTTTISSANAASSFSDETGSGLVVFNTSPEISTSLTTASSSFDLLNTAATTINFAGAASTLNIGPGSTTATSVNLAGGSGATGCTVDGATGNFSCTGTISGSNTVWQYTNGALSPITPYTNNADLLVGSNASSSAKFAVLNVLAGTPTASVSSGVSGNSMFMTADGTLSTTRRQTLNIGNSSTYNTTGNVYINSNGSGNVGIGTTSTGARLSVLNATSNANIAEFIGERDGQNINVYFRHNSTANTNNSARLTFQLNTTTQARTAFEFVSGFADVTDASRTSITHFASADNGSYGNRMTLYGGSLGIGTESPTARLDINGTASTSATLTFRGTIDPAINVLNGESFSIFTSPGGNAGLVERLSIANDGNIGVGFGPADKFKLQVDGDIGPEGDGIHDIGSLTQMWENVYSFAMYQNGNQVCDVSGNCGTTNYWRFSNGAISPYNDTLDLLVGANATASAKFAVLNVNSGTPVASVSSGVSGNSMFMSADGTLSTTRRQSLTIGNSSTYNTTGNVLINPNGTGNVGIGTTAPNNLLEVVSSGAFPLSLYRTANTTLFGVTLDFALQDSTNAKQTYADIYGGITTNTSGDEDGHLVFRTTTAGSISEKMRIDHSGNVAIGTSTAATKFLVYDATAPGIASVDSTNGVSTYMLSQDTFGLIGTSTSHPLILATGNTARMYFDTAGNVGVGTTTTSSFKIEVAGSIGPSADDTYDLGSSSRRWRDVYIGSDSLHIGTSTTDEGTISYNTTSNIFNFGTDSTTNGDIAFFTDDLYLDKSSGSIGVGTTTPTYSLDVESSANTLASFVSSTNRATITIEDDDTQGRIGVEDSYLYFGGGGALSTANLVVATSVGGNVGIGTTSPLATLAVNGLSQVIGSNTWVEPYSGYNAQSNISMFLRQPTSISTATPIPTIVLSNNQTGTATNIGSINFMNEAIGVDEKRVAQILVQTAGATDDGDMTFRTYNSGTASNALIIKSNGNVGIGTTTVSRRLHVYQASNAPPVRFQDTDGYCEINPTSATWSCTSDARLKKDITTLSSSVNLDKIKDLNTVSFHWKTQNDDSLRFGFIAQEVEEIFPEFVRTDETGIKSVDYGAFTPIIISAIQEQQSHISALANNQSQNLTFNTEGELAINGSNGNYAVAASGNTLTTIFGASRAVVGKLTAGLINARQLVVTQTATIADLSVTTMKVSGQNINDYIRGIVQQELQTTSLPAGSLAEDFTTDNLTVTENASISGELTAAKIETNTLLAEEITTTTLTASTSSLGSLLADSASISGDLTVGQNASIAGTLIAGQIEAQSSRFQTLESRMAELESIKALTAEIVDATVSGTLFADNIYNFDEKVATAFRKPTMLELLTNSAPPEPTAASPASIYEPVELAGYASTNPDIIATDSAILALDETDVVLGASALFVEKYLEVNGHGYVAQSLGVGETLKIGNSLILTNGSINYQPAGVENPVLAIQSSGQGKLDFLAGVMTIESGQVAVTGDLTVAGRIKADTLLTDLVQPADFGNPFQVQVAGASTESGEIKKSRFEIIDENGEAVATFDSEGNASFQGGISVANQDLAEEELEDNSVTTDKSSGQAKLKSGKEDLKIITPKAAPDSLIYVTPKGSTDNKVLYIKGQGEGEFTVGFDDALDKDVEFNWWIVN